MTSRDTWRILIVGAGQTGVQLAAQCAAFGQHVKIYDTNQEKRQSVKGEFSNTLDRMLQDRAITSSQAHQGSRFLTIHESLPVAAEDVDVVVECVPEDTKIKREVLQACDQVCGPDTIFATNASYLLPSSLAAASGRPDRFAAFHFHVPIWRANLVDVMPHKLTSEDTLLQLCAFAQSIGQIPVKMRKESPGYVFNAMMYPWLLESIQLAANDVLDYPEIDRVWMGITKMNIGPFGVLDNIGIDVAHKIAGFWAELFRDKRMRRAEEFLGQWVERQELGVKTHCGFYKYPDPDYSRLDFLSDAVWAKQHILDFHDWSSEYRAPEKSRFVCTTVAESLPDSRNLSSLPEGTFLIYGEGQLASELNSMLASRGRPAHSVNNDKDIDRLSAEGCLAAREATHLVLLPESIAADEQTEFAETRTQFDLITRWYREVEQLETVDQCVLIAGVRLGGDFTGAIDASSPESGMLAGAIKGMFMEGAASNHIGPRCCVVDLGALSAAAASANLIREMSIANQMVLTGSRSELVYRHSNIEVGYLRGERRRVRLQETPIQRLEKPQLDGTWLVTGGLRGITAKVAMGLARCGASSLHLLGRTPLSEQDYLGLSDEQLTDLRHQTMRLAYREGTKPNEAWQRVERQIEMQANLHQFRSRQIDANYHVCDVNDLEAVAATVAAIRQSHGPIVGVIHGAGVEVTGRVDKKSPAIVNATMAPKLLGTQWLMRVTQTDPLQYFIGFGSLAGRFGGVGQADYSGANEAMSKLINRFREQRPSCASCTLLWPGWSDVGMAARRGSFDRLSQLGHNFLSPQEGVAWVLHEIATGAPNGEVVIVQSTEVPDLWKVKDGRESE